MTGLVKPAISALTLTLCIGAITVARADTLSITGTRFESLPAAVASGRCYPGASTLYVNNTIGTATGTSNFGNFLPGMSACLNVPFPAPITDGVFTWTFDDGDTLTGTWSGLDTRVNLPGGGHLLTINESYVVAGGTGAFLNSTGEIDETGSAVSTGVSAIANYTFQGTLTGPNLVATPEPSSLWFLGTALLLITIRTAVKFADNFPSALSSSVEEGCSVYHSRNNWATSYPRSSLDTRDKLDTDSTRSRDNCNQPFASPEIPG